MFISYCTDLNKIRTPEGNTRPRYLTAGDEIFNSNGELDTIKSMYQTEKTFFRLSYEDGREMFLAHDQQMRVMLKKRNWKWQYQNASMMKEWIKDEKKSRLYVHPIYPEFRLSLGLDTVSMTSEELYSFDLLNTSASEKVSFLKKVFKNTHKNKISIKKIDPDLYKCLLPVVWSMGGTIIQNNEWTIIYFDCAGWFGHEEVSNTPYHVIKQIQYIGKLPAYKITASGSVVFDNFTTFSLKI